MIESPPQTLPVGTKPYGDKVARVTEGTQISFVELEARSNQPANALVSIIRDNLDGPPSAVSVVCAHSPRPVSRQLTYHMKYRNMSYDM